jgi:hypothetical protein
MPGVQQAVQAAGLRRGARRWRSPRSGDQSARIATQNPEELESLDGRGSSSSICAPTRNANQSSSNQIIIILDCSVRVFNIANAEFAVA